MTLLRLTRSLTGVCDFDVLRTEGFSAIAAIELGSGRLQEAQRVPTSVRSLSCMNNELRKLPQFSRAICEIDVSGNQIAEINLLGLSALLSFRARDNKLCAVTNLPSSLEHIDIYGNAVRAIDLDGLFRLKTLECTNNPGIVLHRVPMSCQVFITSYVLDQNEAGADIDTATINNNVLFEEAFLFYMQTKQTYNDSKEHKCVLCNKEGGISFTERGGLYRAKWDWNFQVFSQSCAYKRKQLLHK
jgi:hypothetical protein